MNTDDIIIARAKGIEAQVYELDAWYRQCEARDVQHMIAARREKARLRAVGPVVHTDACKANPTPFCTCGGTRH